MYEHFAHEFGIPFTGYKVKRGQVVYKFVDSDYEGISTSTIIVPEFIIKKWFELYK